MEIFDVRYGTAYIYPLSRGPQFFANGILARKSALLPPLSQSFQRSVGKWHKELSCDARHLNGWFRDVFPVNILSESHVQTQLADGRSLLECGVGKFIKLSLEDRSVNHPNMWLWRLHDEELPVAFARWSGNENLEERVDGIERIDPVVLRALREAG